MDVTELINDILENSEDVWQYSQKMEGYLALIFNSFYTGQVDKIKKLENEKSALGMLLKELHELVETGKEFTCEAHETLQKIIEIRCRTKSEEATEKMRQDYARFLLIRKQRNKRIQENNEARKNKSKGNEKKLKTIAELHDQSFWGTAQQLRSGKVVSDFLGGLDPVFGVLLNVTGKNTILDNANTPFSLKLKEALYIRKYKPDLNKQIQHFNTIFQL